MAMSFLKPWTSLLAPDERVASLLPTLDVVLAAGDSRLLLETFLVDSGADISMAPRQLCDELGLDWDAGDINLRGISPRPECDVPAKIFEVELLLPDDRCRSHYSHLFRRRRHLTTSWPGRVLRFLSRHARQTAADYPIRVA